MTQKVGRVLIVVGAIAFLLPGTWAFLWPHSFHKHVAMFDPFNLHLLHDVGAFQIGIGAALVAALAWHDDALSVALLGATTGALVHAISHVIDRSLGGRPSDPWTMSVLAILLGAALVLRRSARQARPASAQADK